LASRFHLEDVCLNEERPLSGWGRFQMACLQSSLPSLVLELKPPEHRTIAALAPLWPTALSYAASYEFIPIVWMNHHHLLRFTDDPTPRALPLRLLSWFSVGTRSRP
jgi:hypothetical protein